MAPRGPVRDTLHKGGTPPRSYPRQGGMAERLPPTINEKNESAQKRRTEEVVCLWGQTNKVCPNRPPRIINNPRTQPVPTTLPTSRRVVVVRGRRGLGTYQVPPPIINNKSHDAPTPTPAQGRRGWIKATRGGAQNPPKAKHENTTRTPGVVPLSKTPVGDKPGVAPLNKLSRNRLRTGKLLQPHS